MHDDVRPVRPLRRRDAGEPLDQGFSVIELVIVVVILGVLAAIAVPIFLTIQSRAEQSALDTIAAHGAQQVEAYLSANPDARPTDADLDALETDGVSVTVTGDDADTLCVVATRSDGREASAGAC